MIQMNKQEYKTKTLTVSKDKKLKKWGLPCRTVVSVAALSPKVAGSIPDGSRGTQRVRFILRGYKKISPYTANYTV